MIRLTLVFRTCSLNVEEFPHGDVGARQEEVLGLYQGEKSVFLLLTLDFSRARPQVQQAGLQSRKGDGVKSGGSW